MYIKPKAVLCRFDAHAPLMLDMSTKDGRPSNDDDENQFAKRRNGAEPLGDDASDSGFSDLW